MAFNLVSHAVKQFDGLNFREWYFRTSATLKAEGLLSYIKDEKPTPVPTDWELKDAKAQKIIVDRVVASQLELIMYMNTAKEMMDELTHIHSYKDTLNCLATKRKLLALSFKEDGDPAQHLAAFEALINELKGFGEEIKDDFMVAHLQLTFPKSFDNVVAYFDALSSSDCTLSNLKARFVEECSKRKNRSKNNQVESRV